MTHFPLKILVAVTAFSLSLMVTVTATCQTSRDQGNSFPVFYRFDHKDSLFNPAALKLQARFESQAAAITYIREIPAILLEQGFAAASVDSLLVSDTLIRVVIYPGERYNWSEIRPGNVSRKELAVAGFRDKDFYNRPLNIRRIEQVKQRLLRAYANQGYPFAKVMLDSVELTGNSLRGQLHAEKGLLYHVDSIRVFGKVKIKKYFLAKYLSIPNGSLYSREKLEAVDKRMQELLFVSNEQPSDLTMLGTGSVLNLYLKPRRASRADFLVGFLPSANNTGKLQVTADVNLNLKNLFGSGETMLLKWQQLQPKSPRLNIGYAQPYVFRSSFGIDMLFDLFRKDSSFLQLNAQAGVQYEISTRQSARIFVQWQSNSLLPGGIDTLFIKAQKRLPVNIDVASSNVGLQYDWNSTDYRYNPSTGNDVMLNASVGIKNIRRNNDVLALKDPSFDYASLYDSIRLRTYQLRLRGHASHYFSLGRYATLKASLQGGIYESPEIFRNELFQIGGFRLLRGFDEESIYATRYAVLTAEWRYLISLNSYLFLFTDAGAVRNRFQDVRTDNRFISAGIGIMYETKAGLLNISYALGRRDDVPFNLREASKLHFGYINYF